MSFNLSKRDQIRNLVDNLFMTDLPTLFLNEFPSHFRLIKPSWPGSGIPTYFILNITDFYTRSSFCNLASLFSYRNDNASN